MCTQLNSAMSYKDWLVEGEFIILEMKRGDVFEGDVTNVCQNFCELINVMQFHNPSKLQGVYTFYRNEIHKVFKLSTKMSNSVQFQVNPKLYTISELDRKEYDRIKNLSENYIYLENADHRYYKAIEELENNETIGVIPFGLDNSITTDIKLLGICTHQKVYLFDMANLKERYFYPELKRIFESKIICKVLHGGMAFIEILKRTYHVNSCRIFDTQVTDLFIEKINLKGKAPKLAKSLERCISIYLKLPQSILKTQKKRTRKNWSERPLSNKDKLSASELCTYLLKLQQRMKNLLLKNAYNTIDAVHNHVYNSSESEFKDYVINSKLTQNMNGLFQNQE